MQAKFRKRSRVASGAVVVTAALVLSACSAGAGDDGEGSDGAGDSSGGGGAEEVTLEFSLTGGTVPAQAAVLDEAISAFEDANEGVTINMTEVGWNDSFGQYQTRLSAGNPPDIALLAPPWVATFMENDAFASVDEYVDPSVLDNAYESGYDGMVGEDGTRYGVQWDASIWGMFYRTDLFEAAGLDPESPPATWDELREVSAALVESGVEAPLAFPFAGTNPDDFFLPMMWQAGAEVVNEEGEVVFDSSETLEAATFLKTLVDEGYVSQDIVGQDWEATMNSFIAGDAAIMYNGPWVVGSLQSNAPELDGSWATAQYPEGPGGKGTLGYPNGLVISALSDHKEIAGDFISFLFQEGDPSYFFEYMKVTGVFGFTKDFAETDDEFVTNPLNVPFLESVEFARNRPTVPWYEEFRQRAFTPGLQEIVLGSLTPEQFVEEATEAAEQLAGQ